jgi:hypothetical protein
VGERAQVFGCDNAPERKHQPAQILVADSSNSADRTSRSRLSFGCGAVQVISNAYRNSDDYSILFRCVGLRLASG